MGKYNFDEIVDRHHTNSMKYDAGRVYNPDLPEEHIPMWVADMDFAVAQPILDAMHARLDKRILGYSNYPSTLGDDYYDAVCGWLRRRHGIEAKRENIAFAEAVVSGAFALVETLTDPGDSVMILTPSYQYVYDPIWKLGRNPVKIPLINTDGYYTIDFELFEEVAKRPDVKMFTLVNPHNPSGRVFTEEELRKMAEICFANGVRIFIDEIHNDLVRQNVKMISMHSLFPGDPRIVTAMSISKSFNCAANHHSYYVTYDRDIWNGMNDSDYVGTTNPLGVEAIIAAYNYCEDWIEEVNAYIDGNMHYLAEYLRENLPRAKFRIPEGTYLAWVDMRGYGMTEQELSVKLSRAGLYLEYASEFVADHAAFVRMNMACPRSTVEKACRILKETLEG